MNGGHQTPPAACPRGCVDTDGCGCEWNAKHESASLFAALETLCQDSLESSLEQVRSWPPGDQITDAMQTVIRAADLLARIRLQQGSTLETLRINGVVFDGPLGVDPKNWQHVAFSIYTDLCEVDSWAREALGG